QDMGKVKIKDAQGNVATVTATDIAGSNGVIHVIDRVILPADVDPAALLKAPTMAESHSKASHSMNSEPMGPSIAAVASGNDNFKTLVTALGAANLVETFDSPGEYTVFAPTDDAFGKLPEGTVNTLATQQKEQLKGILAYHVVPAKITAAKLIKAIEGANNYYMMQTLGGETLVATMKDGNVQLIDGNGNRSTIVLTDVEASNGIIHAIDTVIMPRQ
ncbi:MAG: fasciclin domain-containing protein, partial [Bacteroidota bacterium]